MMHRPFLWYDLICTIALFLSQHNEMICLFVLLLQDFASSSGYTWTMSKGWIVARQVKPMEFLTRMAWCLRELVAATPVYPTKIRWDSHKWTIRVWHWHSWSLFSYNVPGYLILLQLLWPFFSFFRYRLPLTSVGQTENHQGQEMLHNESEWRLFLLRWTNLVEVQ